MNGPWIIIPTRNGLRWLPECLGRLHDTVPDSATILVVDNASTDGSVQYVEQHHPRVRVMRLSRNLGFVQATNLGILAGRQRGAESFVLLNNDTRVHPDWWRALHQVAESQPSFGILGSWQTDFDGHPSPRTQAIVAHAGLSGIEPLPTIIPTDWVEGSCLWIRREALDQIGYLDPLFAPAYFEEIDWCRRARRAGWQIGLVPSSRIEHYGAGSSLEQSERHQQRILNERNYQLFHAANPNVSDIYLSSLKRSIRHGIKAWRQRRLSLREWATAWVGFARRFGALAEKRKRDRQNRPCPILGNRAIYSAEQRYYAASVHRMTAIAEQCKRD
jgi:GT2 family glycosyltransferase